MITELPPDLYEDTFVNIFILDEDYRRSAILHPDKCLPKMILESAQLASNAIRMLSSNEYADKYGFYRGTHINHPCSVWVRASKANFIELVQRTDALHDEYLKRGYKFHNSYRLFKNMLKAVPHMVFPQESSTPHPRCFNKASGITPDYSIDVYTQYRWYMLTKSYTKISDPLIMYLDTIPESANISNPELKKLCLELTAIPNTQT